MKIGIVGLGLIGGSLAGAFSKNHEVFGLDLHEETVKKARQTGLIKGKIEDFGVLDMLIFAVTPNAFLEIFLKYIPKLKDGAFVLDIAGNKRRIIKAMKEAAAAHPKLQFAGTHPMAGKESWGIESASAELFKGASMLYLPVSVKDEETLKALFKEAGFAVIKKTCPEEHDAMIAYTSQLPHVISASYIKNPASKNHKGFSAGSFRDLTRVSKLNSEMWAELFIENADNLTAAISNFQEKLDEIKKAIEEKDFEELEKLLAESNAVYAGR